MTQAISHVVEFDIVRGGYTGPGALNRLDPGSPEEIGTLQLHLYGYIVPETVKNFCQIANGVTVNSPYRAPQSVSYAG